MSEILMRTCFVDRRPFCRRRSHRVSCFCSRFETATTIVTPGQLKGSVKVIVIEHCNQVESGENVVKEKQPLCVF